jgi:hypothetical protein
MPLSEVSNAIYAYLEPSNSNIANFGTLYQSLPKVANEADLFVNTYPGVGVGATIYQFFTNQRETREALGGPHDGRKLREYTLTLMIIMKSDLPGTEEGQLLFYALIDDLTTWIQADRNAGTEAVSLGGTGPYAGSGVVWQWGEGGINGGPDIDIQHMIPRTIDGEVTLFQSVAHITVLEFLNT